MMPILPSGICIDTQSPRQCGQLRLESNKPTDEPDRSEDETRFYEASKFYITERDLVIKDKFSIPEDIKLTCPEQY